MTRKYYYSLCLEEKYKHKQNMTQKSNVFITHLSQCFSVPILQGSERLFVANFSAEPEH